MIQEPTPRYKIGDAVRIVDIPYTECPFSWIDYMNKFCGKEAIIEDVYWNENRKTHGYVIDIDDNSCTWCENCFAIDQDLEESDADLAVLFK